jgi:beta-lactam-binding protein with PASTA domain/TolA-binding protein
MIHSHQNFSGRILWPALLLATILLAAFKIDQAQTRSPLPFPGGAPKAVIKSVMPADPMVRSGATVSRAGLSATATPGFLLYVGDVIETQSVKVTVEFLDEPYAERQNEVIIDVNARVGISSTYSWWGTVWAKVKGAFESKTTYAQAGATGTEYEFTVFNPSFSLTDPVSATLVVIEGTVAVKKPPDEVTSENFERQPRRTIAEMRAPQFLLANFIPAFDPQDQYARTLDVPPGERTSFEVTYHLHNDCKQKHRIEFRPSDTTPWLQLQGSSGIDIQGGQNVPVTLTLLIDATRLSAGRHEARIYAVCVDCQREAKCPEQQLTYPLSVNVTGVAEPTPSPTPLSSSSPNPLNQVFSVSALQLSPVTRNLDQAAPAPTPRIESVLNWTNQVLVSTQPTYSTQNLIPHFGSVDERSQNFVAARARAVLTNAIGSHTTLGNVYSDWGRAAWAVYAYDKDLRRRGAPTDLPIDRGEALRLTGKLDEAAAANPGAAAGSLRAQNLLGNIALDRARIALDQGNMQAVDAQVKEAKGRYASAQGMPTGAQVIGVRGNGTIQANMGEANIVAGEAALRNNSPQVAQVNFADAARGLESNQQGPAIYPFPTTDLGVAYRGLGDAAALSGDIKAAEDSYARAKQQHEQATKAHPDFAEAYFNLGDLYDDLGDYENAKKFYRLAIQARPEQPASYLPLAVLLQSEDPQLAAALAATFLKLEREPFKRGEKAATADKIAHGEKVIPAPRPGGRITGEVIVPNVLNQTQDEGMRAIRAAGFAVGTSVKRSDTKPDGTVIEQKPEPGAKVARGSSINLVISTGPAISAEVIVPDLLNKSQADAIAAIEAAGLKSGRIEARRDNRRPRDQVIAQNPRAGKKVNRDSAVDITVTTTQPIEVPGVIDDKEQTAIRKLSEKGLVGKVEQRESCKVGEVIETIPPRRTMVEPGSTVRLVVGSLGEDPVTVPNFIGQDRREVETAMRAGNLVLGRIRNQETDRYPEGTVSAQSPSPGSRFARSCSFQIDLSIAIPLTVGNYVGMSEGQARQEVMLKGLSPEVRYQQTRGRPDGTVFQQDPLPGTATRRGAPVVLFVVQRTDVRVPDVRGMKLEDARVALTNSGLTVGTLTRVIDSDRTPGTVRNQSVSPGQFAPAGTRVDLEVVAAPRIPSAPSNQVTVPQVCGMNLDDAKKTLAAAGLVVDQNSIKWSLPVKPFCGTGTFGTVINQSPGANSSASRGTRVTLTLADTIR